MQRIILLSFLLFAVLHGSSALEQAIHAAQVDNKNVVVLLMKPDCPGCWYMEHIVLQHSAVTKRLNQDFVVVAIDVETSDMADRLPYAALPTTYILTPSAQVIDKLEGAKKRNVFIERLDASLVK